MHKATFYSIFLIWVHIRPPYLSMIAVQLAQDRRSLTEINKKRGAEVERGKQ